METDFTALGSDISDPVLHDIYPFELDGRGCVVSDRPGSDDLSVLYRSVCLDHLLCEKAGKGIYHGQRLFLLRQFASKIRTMQFTLGTLTSLFTLALLGASVAFMFCDFENTALKAKFPFDVLIYSDQVQDDFQDEKEVLQQEADVKEMLRYHIYTDQKDQINTWDADASGAVWYHVSE